MEKLHPYTGMHCKTFLFKNGAPQDLELPLDREIADMNELELTHLMRLKDITEM